MKPKKQSSERSRRVHNNVYKSYDKKFEIVNLELDSVCKPIEFKMEETNRSDDDLIILKSKARNQTDRSELTDNNEQLLLLESAKDKLRMATIERKRMTSLNAESKFKRPVVTIHNQYEGRDSWKPQRKDTVQSDNSSGLKKNSSFIQNNS